MATINELKELEAPGTPLFLFDCALTSGDIQRWSTHRASVGGQEYSPRVLRHNLFELKSSPEAATDGVSKISITVANADGLLSAIERNVGWKGAQLTVMFLFFDLRNESPASDSQVVFKGVANPPDESTDSTLRLSFMNRLNLQRVYLPDIRIQRRCPWSFPATAAQRQEAVGAGAKGQLSTFYRCGYSPDQQSGVGNLEGETPYTSCDYTRAQCEQRGMFNVDEHSNITRRFGGIEFVPASIVVRSYGEKGSHVSVPLENQALYNDLVPLIYGTGWYQAPIAFARNDGNLTRLEVLLGAGELSAVLKVVVNSVELPLGVAGTNMTATGWYNVVTLGAREGNFNPDFTDASGNPLGDPYGNMGMLSVVVPNRISDGRSLPHIQVLIQGLKLARYDSSGSYIGDAFTNNPAWVLLDVLRRSGWSTEELDLASFAAVAQRCDALVHTVDLNGTDTLIPRFQCNLLLTKRRSAGDLVRGIRNSSALYLTLSSAGLLQLNAEDTIALQQPAKPASSNGAEMLNGGWPAYEFGERYSGIVRRENGAVSLRVSSRSTGDTVNRYTVEFQDEFNEYQQDSLSLVDVDDSLLSGNDISGSLTALGLPNLDQATRAAALQLYKSVHGNTYIEFETSVKGVGLKPGDLVTLSYAKLGFDRQPFRIVKLSPGLNFLTAVITAQIHDDAWYTVVNSDGSHLGRQAGVNLGLPRPLVGSILDTNGEPQFGITESCANSVDGTVLTNLSISFSVPEKPVASKAGIPLVSLNPQVSIIGGSLAGGQNLYYAVSAVDADGAEGGLSFTIVARIPAGTTTNQVTLTNLSFSSAATAFHVYRGINPTQLLRINENVALAAQFTDSGTTALLKGPPDYNYDHANFYWRLELQPETADETHSPFAVGNSTLNMLAGEYSGATARITVGTGAGQERTVVTNTATTLTVATKWDVEPDTTSRFLVADSSWHFGASSNASPVSFLVPNREGVTIHVSGRAANVHDDESAFDLSPLTRWRISGGANESLDADVPPAPTFGFDLSGRGTVEIAAIGFASLTNTRTIAAGTVTIAYWNELNGPSSLKLSGAMEDSDTTVNVGATVSAQAGDLVQIETEIVMVASTVTNANAIEVVRGAQGTIPVPHAAQSPVYCLEKRTFVMPFARDFFGSPASGSYSYPILIPHVRIAAGELFMTNSKGNSDVSRQAVTATTDFGLRTLIGGQLSIQVQGPLAIQSNAAPLLLVDSACSVRDIFAVVQDAPTGAPITLQLTQNGQPYCQLTIPDTQKISNIVDGFALGPLETNAQIGLDILAVAQTADTTPGRDLTVTIRL